MRFPCVKEKIVSFACKHPSLSVALTGAATVAMSTSSVSAAAADSLPQVAVTEDMLSPLVDGVVSNIAVILPIGIALLAIFLGIKLIPKIIGYFVH